MDTYLTYASRSIRDHMRSKKVSASVLAKELGIARGTFYCKLSGARSWSVAELDALARAGVALPPLGYTRKGVKK